MTVPNKSSHRVTVAVENIRLALPKESFVTSVRMALDDVHASINGTQEDIADDDRVHGENVGIVRT